MERVVIYTVGAKTGIEISEQKRCRIATFSRSENIEKEDYITLRFNSKDCYNIETGSYIIYDDITFTMMSHGVIKKTGSNLFDHTFIFHSPSSFLKSYKMTNEGKNYGGDISFYLNSQLEGFLRTVSDNAKRIPNFNFQLTQLAPNEIYDSEKNIHFDNVSLWDAIKLICGEENYDVDYWFSYEDGKCKIHIEYPKTESPLLLSYGEGLGLSEITKEPSEKLPQIGKLYVQGSDKNLPKGYKGKNLLMPNGVKFLEHETVGLGREEYAIFDDIYPTRTGKVTSVPQFNRFIDENMNFDLNQTDENGTMYLIAGTTAKIHFNSGSLEGYQFEIIGYNHSLKQFTIKPNESDFGETIPKENSVYTISPEDKYVILDIRLPQSYVTHAEHKLKQRAERHFEKVAKEPNRYTIKIDPLFIRNKTKEYGKENIPLSVGDSIALIDGSLEIDELMQIQAKETSIIKNSTFTYGDISLQVGYPRERKIDYTVAPIISLSSFMVTLTEKNNMFTHVESIEYEAGKTIEIPLSDTYPALVLPMFSVFIDSLGGEVKKAKHTYKIYKDGVQFHSLESEGYVRYMDKLCYLGDMVHDNPSSFIPKITQSGKYTFELTVYHGETQTTKGFDINIIKT